MNKELLQQALDEVECYLRHGRIDRPTWLASALRSALARSAPPSDKDDEIVRLAACLQAANASAEKFEREWYLKCDEIESIQAQSVQPKPDNSTYELVAAFSGFYGGRPVIRLLDGAMILPTNTALYACIDKPKETK